MNPELIDSFMDPRIRRLSIRPCRGHTRLMFSRSPHGVAKARRLCFSCEARSACLAYALYHREMYGVWGGTSPNERWSLLSALSTLASAPLSVSAPSRP